VRPGRILLAVFGSIAALLGLVLALVGAVGLWTLTQRDDGYFTTTLDRVQSSGYAVASEDIDLGTDRGIEGDLGDLARVRVIADGPRPVFIGIGPERAVDAYLRGVPHHEVEDVEYDPLRPVYAARSGTRAPARPGAQDFWAARAEGAGERRIDWDLREGSWVLVVMNADGSPGVVADLTLGLRIEHLLVFALALLLAGLALLGGGVAMVVFGIRRRGPPRAAPAAATAPAPAPATPTAPAAPAAPARRAVPRHPLRIEGELDPDLSRGLWLVKWLLVLPHLLVLLALFLACIVVGLIAFFAILFTARYPRALWDFTLGVLRWSWRVNYYAYGALGTDRYPPFTLGPAPDYPATLALEYPERLSRGLVLVKSWLLAIPHLLVLFVLGGPPGGFLFWASDVSVRFSAGWGGGGLLAILVLIAGVMLLFRKRYPREIFDLVMGFQRWTYRVIVYVALMRDDYPPFRLDVGGKEPPSGDAERSDAERNSAV
jgi:hypothetical protein